MKQISNLLLVIVFAVASPVTAQNCDALLEHGLYNVEIRSSERDFQQSLYNRVCSADFKYTQSGSSSAESVGASLSYAGFGIGGSSSGGKTQQEVESSRQEFCSSMSSKTSDQVAVSSEVRMLHNRALETYERCLSLQDNQVRIDMSVLPSLGQAKTVTFGLSKGGGGNIKLTGVHISPSGAFKCEGKNGDQLVVFDKKSEAMISNNQVSMTCERQMTNGVYEGATISLHTNDTNLDTYFERIPRLPELQGAQADDLEKQIEALRTQFPEQVEQISNGLTTNIQNLRTSLEELRFEFKSSRVIATVQVIDGNVISGPAGTTYDQQSGLLTFPNPNSQPFMPVLTDLQDTQCTQGNGCIYGTHFVHEIVGNNSFRVRRNVLDTQGRVEQSRSFIAAIVGM